jgi:hypothetical protein
LEHPEKICFCTHDPTDVFYRNMGYNTLTKLIEKYPFKVHLHAHIHSNIRNALINKTYSLNRSFIALSRFEPESLEPYSSDSKTLLRDI